MTWWTRMPTIDMAEFDADRDAMLGRARDAGVSTILAIGGGLLRPLPPIASCHRRDA